MHPREWEVRKREEAPIFRLLDLSSGKSIKICVTSLEFESEREIFLIDSFFPCIAKEGKVLTLGLGRGWCRASTYTENQEDTFARRPPALIRR